MIVYECLGCNSIIIPGQAHRCSVLGELISAEEVKLLDIVRRWVKCKEEAIKNQ